MKSLYSILLGCTFVLLSGCGATTTPENITNTVSKQNVQDILNVNLENNISSQEERVSNGAIVETDAEARQKYNEAILSNDAQLCERIGNDKFYALCQNTVNMSLASKNNDISYCAKVLDEATRTGCVKTVVMTEVKKSENIDLCDTLLEDIHIKDCRTAFIATTTMNSLDDSNCVYHETNQEKALCEESVAIRTLPISFTDSESCSTRYNDSEQQALCREKSIAHVLLQNAIELKSIDECMNISFPEIVHRCISEVLKMDEVLVTEAQCNALKEEAVSLEDTGLEKINLKNMCSERINN